MNRIYSLLVLFLFSVAVSATDIKLNTRNLPANAVTEAQQKTSKIMEKLSLTNDSIRENIKIVITNRYLELREIHQRYDERNKVIEAKRLSKEVEAEELERSYYQYNSDLYRSRFDYIAWLSFYLNDQQVETVVDAMTYNLFHVRYNDFLDLFPNLTEAEKKRVYHWLIEAREFSMDFETPRKMRQMFTKYRGRINNYLSSRGYDLRKATEEQEARRLKKNKCPVLITILFSFRLIIVFLRSNQTQYENEK